jgi:hypothetical protein
MITTVWLVGFAVAVQVPPPRAAAVESAEFRAERQAIRERETAELKALADRLNADGRRAEADVVLGRIETPPPIEGPTRFVPLPEVVPARRKGQGLSNIPADKPAVGDSREIATIRDAAARALYDLAVRALSADLKHYSLADACLRAVLDRDPDHAEARRLLGYVADGGGWATPFAVQQIKGGKVLHPTYGWVDATWVPHLEQGELPAPSTPGQKPTRWLPAAEADALRDKIERPWRIETEHFQVLADVPLAEAITFGRKLESFHDLFFSLLADVIADDLPLARRFRDKAKASPRPSLHTVYYFATKEEFIAYLRQREGADVTESLGYYPPPQGKQRRAPAYFFRDKGGQLDVTATLFHEVSHQLLFESTSVGTSAYKKNFGNYWVFEGLGTYFETVAGRPDGSFEVGGFVGPRIAVAQDHLIGRGEFVPVEQLVRLGQNGFVNPIRPEMVYLHYAEAMALTVFLMDGHGRQYREDFLDYVRDAHRGRFRGDNGHALEERLGVPYKTLAAEFLAELKARDVPPVARPEGER